jgi:hypothetical protein
MILSKYSTGFAELWSEFHFFQLPNSPKVCTLYPREIFLKTSSFSLPSFAVPESTIGLFSTGQKIKLGLISDFHVDAIHDGKARLRTFLDHMARENPQAIIEMGDFAIPKSREQKGDPGFQ